MLFMCGLRMKKRSQRGASQIEFAISLLVAMFVIFWTWELGMALYTYNVLSDAAKEGVRYAIVHGASCLHSNLNGTTPANCYCAGPNGGAVTTCDGTAANVYAKVREYAVYSLHDISNLSDAPVNGSCTAGTGCILVEYPDSSITPPGSQAGAQVKVTIQYPYIPYINLPWVSPTLLAGASGRIVY